MISCSTLLTPRGVGPRTVKHHLHEEEEEEEEEEQLEDVEYTRRFGGGWYIRATIVGEVVA